MRVLHVAMECLPFSKVGGMADVTGALPAVLKELGIESRVMTPYYPHIYKGPLGREIAAFDVWVGSAAQFCGDSKLHSAALMLVNYPSLHSRILEFGISK